MSKRVLCVCGKIGSRFSLESKRHASTTTTTNKTTIGIDGRIRQMSNYNNDMAVDILNFIT